MWQHDCQLGMLLRAEQARLAGVFNAPPAQGIQMALALWCIFTACLWAQTPNINIALFVRPCCRLFLSQAWSSPHADAGSCRCCLEA